MPKVEPEKSSLKAQIKDTAMVSLYYKLNPYQQLELDMEQQTGSK